MHSSIIYFLTTTLTCVSLLSHSLSAFSLLGETKEPRNHKSGYTRNMRDEKRYLDAQIVHLKKEKEIYEGRYHWYQNQGDLLQFERGYLLDARRYWKLADMAKKSMENIDTAIAILESQKKVLQSHKVTNTK